MLKANQVMSLPLIASSGHSVRSLIFQIGVKEWKHVVQKPAFGSVEYINMISIIFFSKMIDPNLTLEDAVKIYIAQSKDEKDQKTALNTILLS